MQMLTKREILEKVKSALLAQGAQSFHPSWRICVYRGPDGLKCALGHLIPDAAYSPDLEGLSLSHKWPERELLEDALEASGVPAEAFDMLLDLQRMHDEMGVDGWPKEFDRIERKHLP